MKNEKLNEIQDCRFDVTPKAKGAVIPTNERVILSGVEGSRGASCPLRK